MAIKGFNNVYSVKKKTLSAYATSRCLFLHATCRIKHYPSKLSHRFSEMDRLKNGASEMFPNLTKISLLNTSPARSSKCSGLQTSRAHYHPQPHVEKRCLKCKPRSVSLQSHLFPFPLFLSVLPPPSLSLSLLPPPSISLSLSVSVRLSLFL